MRLREPEFRALVRLLRALEAAEDAPAFRRALVDLAAPARAGAGSLIPPPANGDGHGKGLTRREVEVLDLLAQGLRDKEIARRLDMSERTVSKHLEHIYPKLGVRSRTEAALRFRGFSVDGNGANEKGGPRGPALAKRVLSSL